MLARIETNTRMESQSPMSGGDEYVNKTAHLSRNANQQL